jgi:hypothetical protein
MDDYRCYQDVRRLLKIDFMMHPHAELCAVLGE